MHPLTRSARVYGAMVAFLVLLGVAVGAASGLTWTSVMLIPLVACVAALA